MKTLENKDNIKKVRSRQATSYFFREEKMKRFIIFLLVFLMAGAAFCGDRSLLKFRFVNEITKPDGPIPENCEIISVYNDLDKIDYVVEKEIVFDGSHIKQIELKRDQFASEIYEIVLTLDVEGTKIFSDLTANNIGKSLLAQIDNSYLFNAVIRQAITSNSVSVSGFNNITTLIKLKENFDCIDNTNINYDGFKFKKSTFTSDGTQTVDKKDPIQVIEAFLYYYRQNNPKWKNYAYPNLSSKENRFIKNLENLRNNSFASMDQYDIYVEEMSEPLNVPPSFFFRNNDYINVYIPFKLENQENTFIRNINLVINKDGEYFVKNF